MSGPVRIHPELACEEHMRPASVQIVLPVRQEKTWHHVHQMLTEGGEMFLEWEQHPVVFSGHVKTVNEETRGLINISTPDLVRWILASSDTWYFHLCPFDNTWLTSHTTRIQTTDHGNINLGHMDEFICSLLRIFSNSLQFFLPASHMQTVGPWHTKLMVGRLPTSVTLLFAVYPALLALASSCRQVFWLIEQVGAN